MGYDLGILGNTGYGGVYNGGMVFLPWIQTECGKTSLYMGRVILGLQIARQMWG